MLIWRNRHAVLFGYSGSRDRRGKPSCGLALKLKGHAFGRPAWRHLHIGMHGAGTVRGRGCWTFEIQTYRTAPDPKTRVSIKAFVRVKVGLGGKLAPSPFQPQEEEMHA